MTWDIREGDVLDRLREMPDESVHCCVTSPPYFGLRDYGVEGQIGLEPTPAAFVSKMVEVFAEVRRVLRSDGTCFVNLGDSYTEGAGNRNGLNGTTANFKHDHGEKCGANANPRIGSGGLAPKQLLGVPWRVALALQDAGWWLRQDIIWSKPNPMPESVRDRCTKAHEYVFLLTKSARYFWDARAIAEVSCGRERFGNWTAGSPCPDRNDNNSQNMEPTVTRNARSVWHIATQPYPEAHFATFPEELPRRCIKAGCPEGGTVLDPFNGSGTTGLVAVQLGRAYVGIELNPEYAALARKRIGAGANPATFRTDDVKDAPLFMGA